MICKRCKQPDSETDLCPECEDAIDAERIEEDRPWDLGDIADYEADMANDCTKEES